MIDLRDFLKNLLSLCLLGMAFIGCRAAPTPAHPPVTFRVTAADSAQLLMRDLAAAYQQARPYATVQVSVGNSSTALREFALGSADLALVSRSPRADELTQASARAVEIARDGIVAVIHPSNPLPGVSRAELAKIFAGDILNWSELTGQAAQGADAIQVVSREEGSGTRAVFEETIMLGRRVTLTALVEPSESDVLAYVASNPDAIGYVSFNIWQDRAQARALAIDNLAPTLARIRSSAYPLLRRYYLVVPNVANPNLTDFVNFVTSPAGQAVIAARMAPSP
jgi:phosphate transport system substrate-binding protein